MKKEEDFKKISVAVNELRVMQQGKPFSSDDLGILLKGILPTDCTARVELVRANIIIRIKKGEYRFPRDPIPWYCIRNFYQQCRERSSKYRESKSKPMPSKDLLAMIETVKAAGFIVLKRM